MAEGIGWAVKQLIDGKRVRRAGWNGKGMWLIHIPSQSDVTLREGTPYAKAFGKVSMSINAHVDMFTAQGTMQPGWLCSQADLLANDWELFE